ncbi:Lar family restriction alleviation protein [Acetobacter lambici]|uniref:Lar family restriction alleviation protein n=1 Tax=Acetobacter lambici TaxID=1332824 RepID=UPI003415661D
MSKNLNPCPFCAGTDVHEETSFPFYVHCASCRTDGPMHDNADAARDAWNTRKEVQPA